MKDAVEKINKKDFVKTISQKNNISYKAAEFCYDIIIKGIINEVSKNHKLMLSGFGTFYLQNHRGHFVPSDDLKNKKCTNCLTFKFSASKTLNKQIRAEIETENEE